MTNEKLEQCLAQALEKTAPHDVDGVLSRCEKRKGTEIPMKTKPHSLKKWMAMAACLALLLLCGGGLFLRQANAVASVVSIDVNPSIELRVNQNEKVLACVPMNDDAHAILADMGDGEDLKGAKLDVAVNAIVGSLVRNGYLESISSAIMISVEDRDQSRAHRLQQDLSAAVDGILRDSASQASVLTQTVTQDTSLEKQAKDHRISTGKAALVNRILALNNSLSFEELSRLSIGELKDLAETGAPAMPIGMERALEIALLTCGQLGWGLTALEAAVLLLALQYAPRGTRLWKTWWFVELVLALAVTAGWAGVATIREVRSPAQAVVITTERNVPPETAAPVPTAAPKQPQTTAAADAAYIGNRNSMKYHRAGCRYAAQVKAENRIGFDSTEQALTAGYTPCGACKP